MNSNSEDNFTEYMNQYIQQKYYEYDYAFDAERFNDEDRRDDYIDVLREDFFNSDYDFIFGREMIEEFDNEDYLLVLVEVCKYFRDNYDTIVPVEEYLEKEKIFAKYAYIKSFHDDIEWGMNPSNDEDETPVFTSANDLLPLMYANFSLLNASSPAA